MYTLHPCALALLLTLTAPPTLNAQTEDSALIVVEDLGGVSALPYYRALNLPPRHSNPALPNPATALPAAPTERYREADLLPVRSRRLSPGLVEPRTIQVPGLPAMFLIGEDAQSRAWLSARLDELRTLKALGFVINVETAEALASLRELASGLTLVPASGDDLGERLGLHHYPVLITATGIEQ